MQDFFKICKFTFLNIWEKGQAKKLWYVFVSFVSISFLMFEEGEKQENFARISEDLWAYFFLIFEKGNQQKHIAGFYNICNYTFFNISKKAQAKKIMQDVFDICKYTFF